MPHFYLGHGLGLDSAETPYVGTDLGDAFDRRLVLAAGMVLVLEPIVWDEGHSGYRSENVFVITDDGCVNLTDYPYDPLWRLTTDVPDHPALRAGAARARCSPRWRPHDLDVLVLGRVANIRYVSGVPMPLERRHPPVRPRLRGRARDRARSTCSARGTRASPRRSPTSTSTGSRGTR